MLGVGAVCGIAAAPRWAEFHGLVALRVFAAMLLLFLPALAGARLLFAAFHWRFYRRRPRLIWERAGAEDVQRRSRCLPRPRCVSCRLVS